MLPRIKKSLFSFKLQKNIFLSPQHDNSLESPDSV